MRRPTLITLIVLFVLLVTAAVVQLSQIAPNEPYPGPVSGTPLPSGLTTVAPSGDDEGT
jgi:hypothetical protein